MKIDLLLTRKYFQFVSALSPKIAARQSFRTFQKVRKKNIRPREAAFFSMAQHHVVESSVGKIDCYQIGDKNLPKVVLVHGWDSNIGSLTSIANALLKANKQVIGLNLPGHAFSKSNSTNLLECSQGLNAVLDFFDIDENASIISHSFGSAVVAYTLSKKEIKVDKLIFLTNPNQMEEIFREFQQIIGLGNRAYQGLKKITEQKLGESLSAVSVEECLKRCQFNELNLIHDKNDKVLSYTNSEQIIEVHPTAKLHTFENIGHYKMLWNSEVIEKCVEILAK